MLRYAISVLSWGLCCLCLAAPLKNIVILGDSLSDTGNLYDYMHHEIPKSPPYYQGHFSNGPLWNEYLTQHYLQTHHKTLPLLNYAFGGATVLPPNEQEDAFFTLSHEIDTYLLSHADHADPNSMFILWMGGNDYLGLPDDINATTEAVTQGIQTGLLKLLQAGAKHITLMNLPDLAHSPFAHLLDAEDAFHAYTQHHNRKLLRLSHRLQKNYPQVSWIYVDVHAFTDHVFDHAASFDFQNLTDSCQEATVDTHVPFSVLKMAASLPSPQASFVGNCNAFFFFDLIHPTTQVHALLAEHLREIFDQHHLVF